MVKDEVLLQHSDAHYLFNANYSFCYQRVGQRHDIWQHEVQIEKQPNNSAQ